MEALLQTFTTARLTKNGYLLSFTLTPTSPPSQPAHLHTIRTSSSPESIVTDVRYGTVYNNSLGLTKPEATAWLDVYVAFYRAVTAVLAAEELESHSSPGPAAGLAQNIAEAWAVVYEAWKAVTNAVVNGYAKNLFEAWTVPCLYVTCRWLRAFAIKADKAAAMAREDGDDAFKEGDAIGEDVADAEGAENQRLEDCARLINRVFGLCISDRSPIEESRKWAIYYVANLLFKTYFKLNSIGLSKNILRSLTAAGDLPPLGNYPKAHRATFHYYHGVILFLSDDYAAAETQLTLALQTTSHRFPRNRERILLYLVPTRLITRRQLPSAQLLNSHTRTATLFSGLVQAIRKGDLRGFDREMGRCQGDFVRLRIYLTVERARDICLRNLFRKVALVQPVNEEVSVKVKNAYGHETGEVEKKLIRRTRVPIEDFIAGLRVSQGAGGAGDEQSTGAVTGMNGFKLMDGEDANEVERDEAECLIANLIYKQLMKGYISREHAKVVLSKSGTFPGIAG